MMQHFKINPLFFVVVTISCLTNGFSIFLITYVSLILHEGIHLWFLCKHKIPIRKISLEPFGISIQTERNMPENPIIYLSAPIGNFLVAGCFFLSDIWFHFPLCSQWILANLCLGMVNLLPILPLDGGRALLLYLEKRTNKDQAKKRMNLLGLFFTIPLIGCLLILFLKANGGFGITIILIFLCYTLLSGNRLYEYKKLKSTAFRTEKGNLKDAVSVEYLGVPWDYPAEKLLKNFRGEKYHVINVFRNGKLLKTVTETQILNSVLANKRNLIVLEC